MSNAKSISRRLLAAARWAAPALYFVAFPLVYLNEFWLSLWGSTRSRAWDGSGHYGVAQIYDQAIFPDTFGWTHSYFGGMPFPNFYPPLFYWCVAALHHLHLFSFADSFKVLAILPTLLLPAVLWLLSWALSDKDRSIAFWAAYASMVPLLDPRFQGLVWPSGLDYFSTFSIGMYTQPLGLILLLLWFVAYSKGKPTPGRFTLAALLLAATLLSNFFNAITAALFLGATLLTDALYYKRLYTETERGEARKTLLLHLLSPAVGVGLTLFWLVPVASSYKFFVTRPFLLVPLTLYIWVWYGLALLGALCWLRRPTASTWPYLVTCLALLGAIVFAALIAPNWFPLQANRFSATLNFLLVLPVGVLFSTLCKGIQRLALRLFQRVGVQLVRKQTYIMVGFLTLVMIGCFAYSRTSLSRLYTSYLSAMSFYNTTFTGSNISEPETEKSAAAQKDGVATTPDEQPTSTFGGTTAPRELESVLAFAREHADGRYLVEIPDLYSRGSMAYDARALNSYLGAQSTQTLSVVFREASANSLFMNPQINALSFNVDNFGISSVLSDDLDFAAQPIARHLERASFLGVRYLVINSSVMQQKLSAEPLVAARHDFGVWSVFVLRDPPPPLVQVLPYRPALLVSDVTLKKRRSGEYNFTRLSEEQFADGWFDVPLTLAPDNKIEHIAAYMNSFGALVIDRYDCDDCELAYRALRRFAKERPLILLQRDAPLFHRIRFSWSDFAHAVVIERDLADEGGWLENIGPTRHYDASPVRQVWKQIRAVLEANKIPVPVRTLSFTMQPDMVKLLPGWDATALTDSVPVLVRTTYHPNWKNQQADQLVYPVAPMFMLVFVNRPTNLVFARGWRESLGLLASASILLGLCCFTLWSYRGVLRHQFALRRRLSP